MLKALNVGSGQRPFSSTSAIEWINVDQVWHDGMPEPDLICNGAELPYPDESVDYFVLHHCLEHFGCNEAKGLIKEAYRVLKHGGSLLVFVPNLRSLAVGWLQGKISTQIYATNLYGAYLGHEEDRHKWNYDAKSLDEFLSFHAPWKSLKQFDWRNIPNLNATKDWWVLSCEAVK